MSQTKKITVNVPNQLLQLAQAQTGAGISETVRKGLELLAAKHHYAKLKTLKGKVKLSMSLTNL